MREKGAPPKLALRLFEQYSYTSQKALERRVKVGMKKIFSLLLFLLVLVIFTPTLASGHVVAATVVSSKSAMPTPTPMPQKVEYILPYPGILPTHPLYVLKTIRDRIIEFLITDPVRKAEFYILQADKKLNMGVFLTNTGKTREAQQAFADALALREKATATLESVTKTSREVPRYVVEKLMLSLEKHIEVLTNFHQDVQFVKTLVERSKQLFGVAK